MYVDHLKHVAGGLRVSDLHAAYHGAGGWQFFSICYVHLVLGS